METGKELSNGALPEHKARRVEPGGEVQSDRSYLEANAALALELLNRYAAGTLALDAQEQDCGYEFFVNMQKRGDGRVYPDLHKTDERIYFTQEDAQQAVDADPVLKPYRHVVRLVAMLPSEPN